MSPNPNIIRHRQASSLKELRPIVQDLESATRDALNTWKRFTITMEKVAELYTRYASAVPSATEADDLDLATFAGIDSDAVKQCRTFKRVVTRWSLSDAVVDMRAALFAEWAAWNRTERRFVQVYDADVERTAQLQQLRALRRQVEALPKKKDASHLATEKALTAEMSLLRVYVRRSDAFVAHEFASFLKKSLPHNRLGAAKTSAALHRVGRCLVKAFAHLSAEESEGEREENVLVYGTSEIARTPALGVPLEVDGGAGRRSRPAIPASTEAEYGRGFPYQSADEVYDETPVAEGRAAIAA